ncbi:MAG: rod shape-determining protein RodA [Bacteroidetes Order II. Incertae sedis bacterium]|nr:rod shape-determining protein RodA [Bacteroidetes Order II. bacterium]
MRAWYRNLDPLVLIAWLGLVVLGLAAIYSATNGVAAEFSDFEPRENFDKQVMWLGISLVGILIALALPIRFFQVSGFPIYIVTVLLLLAALAFGREVNGAKSWLYFGSIGLQVSELAKVGTILAVAQLVGIRRPKTMDIRFALMVVGLILLPAVLIVLQNDTGTALVFFGLIPIALFWSGLELNLLLLMIAPAVAGYFAIVSMPTAIVFSVLFTGFMWWKTRDRRIGVITGLFTGGTAAVTTLAITTLLAPHQIQRVLAFTNPGAEEFRLGVGYHQVTSMAAIGSGGLSGKGFLQGTQTQGGYVMEQSTDFIFSVIGEEFGFIGSMIVIGLFSLLLIRIVILGANMKHPFGVMVAGGTAGVYLIHIFINMGMATSVLPVIGIPLPFLSYGGSALLANSALLAIVLSLHLRRDDFSIYGY